MRLLTGGAAALAVGLLLWTTGAACRSDLPIGPRDSVPPTVRLVFPVPGTGAYDRDSDGLMDLELVWADSGGAVNPATLRITAVEGGVPGVSKDANLVPGWRLVRLDSTGAVLEETVASLLREGETRLAVSVADRDGNSITDTTPPFRLPPGAFHQAIPLTGMPSCQDDRGVNLALSPDGRKGFVPYHRCVAVFDADGLHPVHFITGVPNTDFAVDISVDSTTGLAYIGGGIGGQGFTVLDTRSEQVVGTGPIEQGGMVASVKVVGDRLFVGESCTSGTIDVYATGTAALLGRIPVGATSSTGSCPNTTSIAIAADGDGWGAVVDAGLAHFDAHSYTMLGRVRLDSAFGGSYWGAARSIRLAANRWLDAALPCVGLEEFDTRPWRLTVKLGDAFHAAPCFKELALSPDETSLFVSADSTGWIAVDSVQTPYLYDVPGLRLRYAFPHRRGGITDAVVWHPDGKRVYMMDEFRVDVYIIRPRPGT